jgi:hypothetical protein
MGLLLFKKVFVDAIRSGQKRTTVRRWDRARVSAGQRVFCPGLGYLRVEAVEPLTWRQLSRADAIADGFATLKDMKQTLLLIYPQCRTDGKRWWRVKFQWKDEG